MPVTSDASFGSMIPVLRSLPTVEGLAGLVEASYGLTDVRCRLIPATVRDTYRVDSLEGPFVMTIYRHGRRTVAEIAAEVRLVDALAAGAWRCRA